MTCVFLYSVCVCVCVCVCASVCVCKCVCVQYNLDGKVIHRNGHTLVGVACHISPHMHEGAAMDLLVG